MNNLDERTRQITELVEIVNQKSKNIRTLLKYTDLSRVFNDPDFVLDGIIKEESQEELERLVYGGYA